MTRRSWFDYIDRTRMCEDRRARRRLRRRARGLRRRLERAGHAVPFVRVKEGPFVGSSYQPGYVK